MLSVASGLPSKRLWNCTVDAYGCREHVILPNEIELSE